MSHACRLTLPRRRGFSLLETALAIIIVGVGVLSMMIAQQAFHQQNRWSMHASTAMRLGHELREMTINLPRHDPVTGFDASLVERICRLIDLNEYKRQQAAPGLEVTTVAFGIGRRMPLAQRWQCE